MFYDHDKLHFVWCPIPLYLQMHSRYVNFMSWMKLQKSNPIWWDAKDIILELLLTSASPWMTLLVSRTLRNTMYPFMPSAHWLAIYSLYIIRIRPVSQVFQLLWLWGIFVKNLQGALPRWVRVVIGHLLKISPWMLGDYLIFSELRCYLLSLLWEMNSWSLL